jgi:hypothetical protein
MSWYIVGSIVTAFLLGLTIGIAIGKSQGHNLANQEYQQQMATTMWTQYFQQMQGGQNERQ